MLTRVVHWATIPNIEIAFDDAKGQACFEQRGFDFVYAAQAFLDASRTVQKDTRTDYGEDRYQLLGKIEGRVFHLAYTHRGAVVRLISARKANAREVKYYENRSSNS